MILFGYWRSSCTWRVRIALSSKGLSYKNKPVHLVREGGEQHLAAHRLRNPMAQVPVLELESGQQLSQSMAILEYLEERYPRPALLPADPLARAKVRQLAELVNAGVQPLQNLAVLQHIGREGLDSKSWGRHYMHLGLDALERATASDDSVFLVGDTPSFAELCLIPQLYNARRFDCELQRWPRLLEVEAAASVLPAFAASHPDNQTDAAKVA